jgi:hypothetical protein
MPGSKRAIPREGTQKMELSINRGTQTWIETHGELFFGALFPYNILVFENFWDSTMTPLTGNSGMPRTPVG